MQALAYGSGLCSADMYPIRPIEGKATREFIWMLLLSDYFNSYVETLPGRANIPKLNRKELSKFSFSLPPIKTQEKYSAVVERTLVANQSHSESEQDIERLFGSLSQKAFAGEL